MHLIGVLLKLVPTSIATRSERYQNLGSVVSDQHGVLTAQGPVMLDEPQSRYACNGERIKFLPLAKIQPII